MEKNRQYSLDLLRILSMMGIMMLHALGQGGLLQAAPYSSSKHWLFWGLEILAYCSVNVFALMSGYLGYGSKKLKSYRVFELLSTVLVHSILLTGIFYIFSPGLFHGVKDILKAFLPMITGRYWYITCYIPVLLLSPFLNLLMESISLKYHRLLCILNLILFSFIPSILMHDYFQFADGYSFAWLMVLYLCGGYMKRTPAQYKKPLIYIGLYFLLGAALTMGNFIIDQANSSTAKYLISYTSPVVVAMAWVLVRWAMTLSINEIPKVVRVILYWGSATAFDVYILHAHTLVFNYIIGNNLSVLSAKSIYIIPLLLFSIILISYTFLGIVGWIRIKLFKAIKLEAIFDNITKSKLSFSLFSNNEQSI